MSRIRTNLSNAVSGSLIVPKGKDDGTESGKTNQRAGDRITAIEVVSGIEYQLILEKDEAGRYREISRTEVRPQ